MVKLITDFCELKSRSDGGLLSQSAFGLRGVGVDLFVKIDEFGMSPAESVQIGSQSPVVEFGSGVLNEGVGGGIGGCRERSSRHLEFQLSREQVLVNLP